MITIHFDSKALAQELKTTEKEVRGMIERGLGYAGREAINAQREIYFPASYRDQSGNLRSSTNFVVASEGEVKESGRFTPVYGAKPKKNSLSPADAVEEGWGKAVDEVQNCPPYPTLILVAGMNYASYVSDKGFDVLSTARIVAEESVREWLEDLRR